MANNKDVKRGIVLYLDGKQVKGSVSAVKEELKKLKKEIESLEQGSREYDEQMAKIRHLNTILKEHRRELRATNDEVQKSNSSIGKLADGFNRYFGMITSFIAGITGVFLTMRKAVSDYLDLDSAYSDVMKYTGMTRKEVVQINEDLKKMDTRTSRKELNLLLADAGRLGIKGRESLLQFVEAADIINVSLGEDLGEGAIKNIGKLATMFGDADRMGLKQAMLSVGSTVNYLGSSTSAAEKYLTEFLARMAGVGKQAKLDVPKIAAYATVLDQDMQQLETSSTALQRIIMKIYQEPAKMARLAGLEVKSFTELVKKDVNEAFLVFLSSLNKLGDMSVLAPLFKEMKLDGQGATSVLADLASNVDKVRETQVRAAIAFREGTSVVDEFAVKNNDLTAQMEKAKGVFQERVYQLGEQLLPLMTKMVSGSSLMVRTLGQLITLGIKYADVIAILSAGILVATVRTKALAAAQALYNGALAAFRAILAANPWTVAILAITAVGTALYKLATYTSEADKAAKSFMKQLTSERSELQKLVRAAERTAEGTRQRKELIDEINKRYGQYLPNLLNEYSSLQDIRQAYDDINQAMQRNIAQKVLDEKTEEISRDMLDKKVNEMNDIRELLGEVLPEVTVNKVTRRIEEVTAKYAEEGKKSGDIALALFRGLQNDYLKTMDEVPPSLYRNIKQYTAAVTEEAQRIKAVKKELATFVPEVGNTNELPEVVVTGNKPDKDNKGSDGLPTGGDKDIFAKAEADYYAELKRIKEGYLKDSQMTQEEYNRQIQAAELKLLNDKLEVAGLEPEKRQQIEDQILNAQIKAREALRKEEEDAAKEAAEAAFTQREKQYQLDVEAATMYHYQEKTSEKNFLDELRRLQVEYYNKVLGDTTIGEDQKVEIRKRMRKLQLDDAEQAAKEEKEIETEKFNTLKDLATGFGESMAEFFTDSEVTMKDFLKNIIKMTLDALQKMLIMKVAERTVQNVGTLGFLGLAKAAGEIALITAAFETAKGLIGNFYTGGYTGPGEWDDPKGIVHSNEFVANRYAVANPAIRPVLDLINNAQRTGSVANITREDIAAVAGTPVTRAAAPAPQVVVTPAPQADGKMAVTLDELVSVIALLKGRLDEPFNTINVISGRDGLKAKLDEYNTLMNNVSRKKNV